MWMLVVFGVTFTRLRDFSSAHSHGFADVPFGFGPSQRYQLEGFHPGWDQEPDFAELGKAFSALFSVGGNSFICLGGSSVCVHVCIWCFRRNRTIYQPCPGEQLIFCKVCKFYM